MEEVTERTPRVRRERTATESLLSIVLALEAAVMFFVTITAFGLRELEPVWVFGGGGALFLLFIVAARVVRYRYGVWLGWLLQAALIATGIVMTLMYFVGVGFAVLWVYCFVTARRLDRKNFPTIDPIAKEAS